MAKSFGTAAINRPVTPSLGTQLKECSLRGVAIVKGKQKHSEKIRA
jgi:hypothetical protein